MRKYIIGLIIAIALIIYIIIRLLTSGGTPPPKPLPLASYANTGTIMRFTIQNAVQAPQNHRVVQIDVGRNNATLTIFRGYDYDVINSKSFPMDSAAYRDFLRGLQISGLYTKGDTDSSVRDESGYCATGNRYVYEIVGDNGNIIQHLWSTSCNINTFQGNIGTVQQLFENEIPNYGDLTANVAM